MADQIQAPSQERSNGQAEAQAHLAVRLAEALFVQAWSPGIRLILDHVASTPGWYLAVSLPTGQVLLRRPALIGRFHCPVSSYGAEGTTFSDRFALIDAADETPGHDPVLRAALLQAGRCP